MASNHIIFLPASIFASSLSAPPPTHTQSGAYMISLAAVVMQLACHLLSLLISGVCLRDK